MSFTSWRFLSSDDVSRVVRRRRRPVLTVLIVVGTALFCLCLIFGQNQTWTDEILFPSLGLGDPARLQGLIKTWEARRVALDSRILYNEKLIRIYSKKYKQLIAKPKADYQRYVDKYEDAETQQANIRKAAMLVVAHIGKEHNETEADQVQDTKLAVEQAKEAKDEMHQIAKDRIDERVALHLQSTDKVRAKHLKEQLDNLIEERHAWKQELEFIASKIRAVKESLALIPTPAPTLALPPKIAVVYSPGY